jgi:outer membrane protein
MNYLKEKKEYLCKTYSKPNIFIMKNLSLILNGILIVAVGVLFYLHFASGPHTKKSKGSDSNTPITGVPIVYINIDTLLNNYDYFADLQGEMQDKVSELEAQLSSRTRTYEKNAQDYQNKVNKGLVTRREAAELEQSLYVEQQEILQLRDQLTAELAEEEQVRNRRLIDNIMVFLKEYNKDYNYQFIFSNSFGSNILYARDSLDITYSVLEGINNQYREQQAAKK